jgi:hypothetical protein
LAFGLSLEAATYEVAQRNPRAADDDPGTTERPWKTLTRSAERAGPGDVVIIRGGVYRERVLARKSGTAQTPIRFEAAPGEHVVVTGADRLTGWEQADNARPIYRIAWPHTFIGWNRSRCRGSRKAILEVPCRACSSELCKQEAPTIDNSALNSRQEILLLPPRHSEHHKK